MLQLCELVSKRLQNKIQLVKFVNEISRGDSRFNYDSHVRLEVITVWNEGFQEVGLEWDESGQDGV